MRYYRTHSYGKENNIELYIYMDDTRVDASHVTVISYTDTCDLESVNKSGVKRLLTSSFVDLDISWFIHWTIHRNTNRNTLTDIYKYFTKFTIR